MRETDKGLAGGGLIALAAVLSCVVVAWLPAVRSEPPAHTSDWLGFAGGAVGGVMTLVAAVMAWFAVQRQLDFQIEQGRRAQIEAFSAAEIVLAQSIHAAAVVASINKTLMNHLSTPPVGGSANLLYSSQTLALESQLSTIFTQLKNALEFFAVAEAWKDLEAGAKSAYLIVTASLHRLIRVYETPPHKRTQIELLRDRHKTMQDFAKALRAFSGQLADVFNRDAGI